MSNMADVPVFRTIAERDYQSVYVRMVEFTNQRDPATCDEVWFVEHNPVFTVGRNGNIRNLLIDTDIPLIQSDRGGDITYHGPGQLVVYCLLDLRRLGFGVRGLVHGLEEVVINYLSEFSIQGHRINKAPGVYVDNRKLASLGLRVRHGCTFHGLAININMNLEPFGFIHPCGLMNMQVTQLESLGIQDTRDQVACALSALITRQFYK